jgi:hypothetical protein
MAASGDWRLSKRVLRKQIRVNAKLRIQLRDHPTVLLQDGYMAKSNVVSASHVLQSSWVAQFIRDIFASGGIPECARSWQ